MLVHHFAPSVGIARTSEILEPGVPFGPVNVDQYNQMNSASRYFQGKKVSLCSRGFHGSKNPVFALYYRIYYPSASSTFHIDDDAFQIYWNPRILSGDLEHGLDKSVGEIAFWPIGTINVTMFLYGVLRELDLNFYGNRFEARYGMYNFSFIDNLLGFKSYNLGDMGRDKLRFIHEAAGPHIEAALFKKFYPKGEKYR